MADTINIYNTEIRLPEQPPLELIDGYGLSKQQQYWNRKELPSFFNKVSYDKEDNLILTDEQIEYSAEEVRRCKNGYWFFNGGIPTYITGKNYFYLQWWKLEDDIYPSYRDTDRRYFLFLDYWEKKEFCYGVVRAKKRREGATSQATANLIYECIFFKDSKCGLVSKTRDDARAAFVDMVSFGYRRLPVFLKQRQINREDSVTELVFAKKAPTNKDGSHISDDEGNRSRVNFKAPALNAYDSGRLSRGLIDETGKFPVEVPASKMLAIISKTLVKGSKRVGFLEVPSTVNSLTKGTGGEFKRIWDMANQFKKLPTTNRLVRYFTPAYDGYEGFIDRYGMSVINEPTEEQYEYLVSKHVRRDEETNDLISELSEEDIRLGAKHYVQVKRREDLDDDDLEEEIRMNSCDEKEIFMSAASDCPFNAIVIKKQQQLLEDNPPYIRKITFYRDLDQKIKWRDDEKGMWNILAFPTKEEENAYTVTNSGKTPSNTSKFVMGCDGVSATQNSNYGRVHGSKAAAFIMNRNTMQYIAMYFGRAETKEKFHEQILMACEFYGCKVWIEKVADSYFDYYRERGRLNYLGKYPLSVIPSEKRFENPERLYGFPVTPFAMTAQLDNMVAYIEPDSAIGYSYCETIFFSILLEQLLIFDNNDRTKSDCVIAATIALCVALEPVSTPQKLKQPLLQTYN